MDLATCSACVVAGSAGGAVVGFGWGRRRRGRRAAPSGGSSRSGRTMRVWPGRRPEHGGKDGAP